MSEIERAIAEIEETRFRENAFKTVSSADGEIFYSRVKLSRDTLELVENLCRAELEREKNPLTCDGCRDEGLLYCGNCIECVRARNYTDNYEPKGEKS